MVASFQDQATEADNYETAVGFGSWFRQCEVVFHWPRYV